MKCHRQQARFLDISVTLCRYLIPLVRPPRNTYTMSSPYNLPMSPPHTLLTSSSYTLPPLRQRSSTLQGTASQTWSSRCCLRATPMPKTPPPSPLPPPPSAPTSPPGQSCASTASVTWCRYVPLAGNLISPVCCQAHCATSSPCPTRFPHAGMNPVPLLSLIAAFSRGRSSSLPLTTPYPLPPLCLSGGPGPRRTAGGSHPGAADRHAEGPHGAADRLLCQLPGPPRGRKRIRRDESDGQRWVRAIGVLCALSHQAGLIINQNS